MKHTNSCSRAKSGDVPGVRALRVPTGPEYLLPSPSPPFRGSGISFQPSLGPSIPDPATSASPSGSGQPELSPGNKQVELARIQSHRCVCIWCMLTPVHPSSSPEMASLFCHSHYDMSENAQWWRPHGALLCLESCTLQELHLKDRP